MRSNNQILERYNPAKEDKKKVSKIKSPTGRIIIFAPGCSVLVPMNATPEEITKRVMRAAKQLAKSLTVEKNPIYKNYKGKDNE